MNEYDSYSVITYNNVERELLRLSCSPLAGKFTPLVNIEIVNSFMLQRNMLDTTYDTYNRTTSLSYFLGLTITTYYQWHRKAHWNKEPKTRDHAIAMIREDEQVENVILHRWCFLYYQYVRFDLHLPHNVFNSNEQDLCKLKYSSIRELTRHLIESEHNCRDLLYYSALYQLKCDYEGLQSPENTVKAEE